MKYVLAISGGVDSVVLLNKIARDQAFRAEHFADALWPNDFLVAHFDHGIRSDSVKDRQFVEKLARRKHLPFVYDRAELGAGASEAAAIERPGSFMGIDPGCWGSAAMRVHHRCLVPLCDSRSE